MEHYSPWQPVPDITTPCADAEVRSDAAGFVLRLRFSQMRGGGGVDLVLTSAPNALALTSYGEFAHPWHGYETGPVPRAPSA